jgi:hypothetical protein
MLDWNRKLYDVTKSNDQKGVLDALVNGGKASIRNYATTNVT